MPRIRAASAGSASWCFGAEASREIHLLFVVGVGGPGVVLGLAACLVGGLAFVLLMVVMRGLLESAIADRTELDEVI